ncbi:hypothetical protein [Streptomyces katrae]|uniref:hypothetical protein n=1 Tax=Streptomyces katrae TaxID=68223 RepID=UPI0004BEF0B0|nr:hypothetical protein [Streptomyces katrae]
MKGKGKEYKRQDPRAGREEQPQEHPGPDPVHPEASRPAAGPSPEDVRRMREREMAASRTTGARGARHADSE